MRLVICYSTLMGKRKLTSLQRESLVPSKKKDNTLIAYCAGLVDGEGCIGIYRRRSKFGFSPSFAVRLSIGMTDPRGIRVICETFQMPAPRIYRRTGKAKDVYVFQVEGKQAVDLVLKMKPFLRVKVAQAELAEEFWKYSQTRANRTLLAIGRKYANPHGGTRRGVRLNPSYIEKANIFVETSRNLNKKGRDEQCLERPQLREPLQKRKPFLCRNLHRLLPGEASCLRCKRARQKRAYMKLKQDPVKWSALKERARVKYVARKRNDESKADEFAEKMRQ